MPDTLLDQRFEQAHGLHEARILVVDDKSSNLALLERLLERFGYVDVHSTTTSADVVRLCHELNPDVLLLDLQMPQPDGFELLRLLRPSTREAPQLPILVLTADMTPEAKRKALTLGAKDYVTKPFDAIEVQARVRNLLETRLLQLELQTHNAQLRQSVQERTHERDESRLDAFNRLAIAAEYRDDDTRHHTQRVGRLSELLALELGLDDATAQALHQAAPLHDVGKIGISDAILLKPGALTPQEFDTMKTHVEIGASILSGSQFPLFQLAAEIALTHHERWDGTGYTYGLSGEEIPLAGRIVAVADVFDALTHDRPYKQAWPIPKAVEEIRGLRGAHFDPAVVDAFDGLDHQDLDNEPA
jgi:putative two-component system response regulator